MMCLLQELGPNPSFIKVAALTTKISKPKTNDDEDKEKVMVVEQELSNQCQTTMLRLVLLLGCVFVAAAVAQEGKRPKISDDALESALNDKRYLQRQLKCALGEATCDPVGRRLKTLAPLVLRGSCPQCTPDEMRQIQRTLSHIQRNYPKEWSKIVKQYAGA